MRRWLVMHTETESRPYYKYLKKKDEKKTSTLYILYLYSFVYYYYFGEFLVYIKKRQYEHCVTMKIVFLLASEWTTNENIILLIYLCQMRVYTKRMLYGYGHVFRVTWLVFKPVKLSTKLHSVRVLYDHNIYIGIHTHTQDSGSSSVTHGILYQLYGRNPWVICAIQYTLSNFYHYFSIAWESFST